MDPEAVGHAQIGEIDGLRLLNCHYDPRQGADLPFVRCCRNVLFKDQCLQLSREISLINTYMAIKTCSRAAAVHLCPLNIAVIRLYLSTTEAAAHFSVLHLRQACGDPSTPWCFRFPPGVVRNDEKRPDKG